MLGLTGLLISSAMAEKPEIGGDVKQFFIAAFPYEHLLMPEGAYSQAYADGRLKLDELITKYRSLDEINAAFEDMNAGITECSE